MGYTHRWSFSRQLTHREYNAIRDAARQIVGRCEIPLADGSGTPGSTPALISPVVSFNGVGDDRCEEFAIWRIQPIRHYDPEDGSSSTSARRRGSRMTRRSQQSSWRPSTS